MWSKQVPSQTDQPAYRLPFCLAGLEQQLASERQRSVQQVLPKRLRSSLAAPFCSAPNESTTFAEYQIEALPN